MLKVKFQKLRDIPAPFYATENSAGADLVAAIGENLVLLPGERKLVPCGFAMALPNGYEAQVRPRSGLALKQGITVLNSPGTIDADYRGEVQVILINHSSEAFTIEPNMRVAQMVIAAVCQAEFETVASLDTTQRGSSGFGSSGLGASGLGSGKC